MRIQAGLKSEPLKVALKNTAEYKVVAFTTMADAFGGFTNPQCVLAPRSRRASGLSVSVSVSLSVCVS